MAASGNAALPLLPAAAAAKSLLRRLSIMYRLNARLAPSVLARSLTGAAGLCAGDLLGQAASGKRFDGMRLARVGAYAILFHSHACHHFYSALDKLVCPGRPASPLSVASKLLVDQALFSPALCAAYYVAMKTLEGTPSEAGPALRDRLWPTVTAAWLFWVPAQCMNFGVVGPEHRVMAALSVNVVWNAVLSTIATANERPVMGPLANVEIVAAAGKGVEALISGAKFGAP
eukprot:evm.model.scf_29.9 EVM.evm.TU.scf_29.9   scf_29:167482-169640(+)